MLRVLIVSPNFPPINAPDVHRVRTALPHFAASGWEPTVLCVDPAGCDGPLDPSLADSLPGGLRIIRVMAWDETACRRFGFGQLAYRSLIPLYRAGLRLLRREHYDVVYFSTTVFLSFALGRLWKGRFGCRVVYDFHDPWYSDDIPYTRDNAPGGWWKYRIDRGLARCLERFALAAADHVIVVSPAYVDMLTYRYPRLSPSMFTVLPFPVTSHDYALAPRPTPSPDAPRGHRWVSVGAYTPTMQPVLEALFDALAALLERTPEAAGALDLRFVGTDYAPVARKRVEPQATARGLGAIVWEMPDRVPYFEALGLFTASDAILMLGSTEAGYTASKLLTCVASHRPILALFHRNSLVSDLAAGFPNIFLATFDKSPAEPQFRTRIAAGVDWLLSRPQFDAGAIDVALSPWSAEALTRRQCAIFDGLLQPAAQGEPRAEAHPGAAQ